MNTAELANWFSSLPVDEAEEVKLAFAIAIDKAIKNNQVSRTSIAERLCTSSAWVTKVLRGDVNLTIESMVKLAQAVECRLNISVEPKNSVSSSITVPEFSFHNNYQPKYGGAYEMQLSKTRREVTFCNDSEYANAA